MTTLKLDHITEGQSKVLFHNQTLYDMYQNVLLYANAHILYNDFQKRLDKLGFRLSNMKGDGVCKIVVRDREKEEVKFLFIY